MYTGDNNNLFTRQAEIAHDRVNSLIQTTQKQEQEKSELLRECFDEIQAAIEELQVAETELRQQNEELLEARQIAEFQRQQYQDLFDFAPDGYLVTDLYGQIQEANYAAAAILNVEQQYLINEFLVSFVPEADRRVFRSLVNQLPTVHRLQEWELTIHRSEDGHCNVALTVEAVKDCEGRAIALRWLIRDITARKQAEEQLRQTQLQNLHLLEIDRLKTQFMATISHELRTPLQAILGFADLALRRLHRHDDRSTTALIHPILRNGRHLLSLIESLLDFARLQAKSLELELEQLDLSELARTTAGELKAFAEQKGLELLIQTPFEPLFIVNDSGRLRQIIVNLLSNAIKFTETGRVTLKISELANNRIEIAVSDTGIGIAPREQEWIFKEFWQVDQSTTRAKGGTGLGLSITRSLVELMQGRITVESQLEAGSCFRVELPRSVNQCIASRFL